MVCNVPHCRPGDALHVRGDAGGGLHDRVLQPQQGDIRLLRGER